jgi:hypothetical protein
MLFNNLYVILGSIKSFNAIPSRIRAAWKILFNDDEELFKQ